MKSIKIIKYVIALIWFINGFYCKILNQVPRHEQIVSKIICSTYSIEITVIIGVLEILMAIWIITDFKKQLNTLIQISIIAVMNLLEFFMTSDLLLWEKFNLLFAIIFIIVIYYNNLKSKKIIFQLC